MRTLTIMSLLLAALTTPVLAQTAAVQVIHNSPDPAAMMVDIYINAGDEPAIDDFAFRAATPVLDLPAGVELVIGIAPGNSSGPGDVLASFPVTLMAGASYLVMATGVLDDMLPGNPDGEDTAFTLKINELMTMAPGGTTNLLVYHGSPDAPTVDVQVPGVGILVDDLTYGYFDGYLNAPATDLVLEITPGSDNTTIVKAYDAPLSALDGAGAVVFASGFLSGDDAMLPAFGLFVALADGTVIPLDETTVAVEQSSWTGVRNLFD